MTTKLNYLTTILFFFCLTMYSQENQWKKSNAINEKALFSKFHLNPEKIHCYNLNQVLFEQELSEVSLKNQFNKTTLISVPGANGVLEAFEIQEKAVLSPILASRYPNIKSYVGYNSENGSQLRMSVSPNGVQTMITYKDREAVFMMPRTHGSNQYLVYSKSDKINGNDSFVCSTVDEFNPNDTIDFSATNKDADDQVLRTYQLAISVTGEYTQYHGGTIEGALSAVNATITRVNAVFETDMAITFEIVDADQLIFTDPDTDPYSDNLSSWNDELQQELTANLGEENYQIGHLFGATGGGGNAGCIGCVCVDEEKGSGITSPADGIPEGDTFDIDYVAHEIGHQMGANHTFSHNTEGTGVNAEPGSGTTIMGYAGITGSNNVQQHSDPYFHYHSINQILNNVETSPNNCATTTTISNNPPNANAGADYNIPQGTAYVLRGSATDADSSDALTYCWEQTDSGQVTNSSFGPTMTSGSTARSLPPVAISSRFIPLIDRVVANQLTETNPSINDPWETVSTVARQLNWALTVRDREPTAIGLNGQSSFDLMQIIVEDVDPFTVGSPNGGELWPQGSTQTVTWNVGQTTNATINCENVNIKLSTDGGYTYPTTLVTNTANDGSETVTIPSGITETARILVEAADNIFYDISNENFSISTTDPDFYFTAQDDNQSACGIDSISFTFDYFAINGFTGTTTFTATGNPTGSVVVFEPMTMTTDGSFVMTISNLDGIAGGDYTITAIGTSGSKIKEVDVTLSIIDGMCASVGTTQYATSTTLVQFGTINNASAKPSGYSDYTAISTDVEQGGVYDLTINMNTDGDYPCSSVVWVDWNQNCVFDADETYDLGSATNVTNGPSSNSPLSVTVPNDAVLGTTTMRVTTKFNSPATSCENGLDGEVEDYSINVISEVISDPDFYFTAQDDSQSASCGLDTISFNFDYFAIDGFTEATTFTAAGNPTGSGVSFSPDTMTADGSFVMTLNNLEGVAEGDYTITVTGSSASITKTVDVTLSIVVGMCDSEGTMEFDTSTTLVQFGTINNASGKPSGYSDYTSITTDVEQGRTYDITINVNTDGDNTCTSAVWVDWNQNCVFDADEAYNIGTASNVSNGSPLASPFGIIVPNDAVLGVTTMRVTTKNSLSISSCENGHDGEVEDYSIHVIEPKPVQAYGLENAIIYPNPSQGEFNVKLNIASNEDIVFSVYDIRGRQVYNNAYKPDTYFNEVVKLNAVESGVYLLTISTESELITKKIVIE